MMIKELSWPKALRQAKDRLTKLEEMHFVLGTRMAELDGEYKEVRDAFHGVSDDNVELVRGLVKLGHRYRDKCRELKELDDLSERRRFFLSKQLASTVKLRAELGGERAVRKGLGEDLMLSRAQLKATLGNLSTISLENQELAAEVVELQSLIDDAMPQIAADDVRTLVLRAGAPPEKADEVAEAYQEAMDLKGLGQHGASGSDPGFRDQ